MILKIPRTPLDHQRLFDTPDPHAPQTANPPPLAYIQSGIQLLAFLEEVMGTAFTNNMIACMTAVLDSSQLRSVIIPTPRDALVAEPGFRPLLRPRHIAVERGVSTLEIGEPKTMPRARAVAGGG